MVEAATGLWFSRCTFPSFRGHSPLPHGMETKSPRRYPPTPRQPDDAAAAAAAMLASMSLVLGDDDLLREILLRAALVCKRWLRHAVELDFLGRFHARHSPHLLGAYVSTAGGAASQRPRFLPIHELPRELAPAARRAGSFFDAFRGSSASIRDSLGGRLLVTAFETHYGHSDFTQLVCSPLSSPSPAGNTAVVVPPQVPIKVSSSEDSIVYYYHEFLPDDGDGRSYSCVLMGYSNQQTTVNLYELQQQDMHWVLRASAAAQLLVSPPRSRVVLLDDSKFYMLSTINKILVCDFTSSTISAMELPDGVELEERHTGRIVLSRADGSGVYLVHVEESQLRVFHSGNAAGNWFLADSVCLREVRAKLGMAASPPPVEGNGSAAVKIHAVGDNARFVFFEMCHAVVLLDIASKQANKMYQVTPEDGELVSVHPLTLTWPPVFPRSAIEGTI